MDFLHRVGYHLVVRRLVQIARRRGDDREFVRVEFGEHTGLWSVCILLLFIAVCVEANHCSASRLEARYNHVGLGCVF